MATIGLKATETRFTTSLHYKYIPKVITYNEQGQSAIIAICSLKNRKIGCRATSGFGKLDANPSSRSQQNRWCDQCH